MRIPRREFIKVSLGASASLSFGAALPDFLTRVAAAAPSARGRENRVLVVLQLSGGNDGLNTVVPYEDDAYHRQRPTLRLTPKQVLKLDSVVGLHPEMTAFLRLYEEGRLSIVQGVGCPKASRDHPAAMRDWHSAWQPDAETGWLGHAVDQFRDNSAPPIIPGAFVGSIKAPFGVHAARAQVPSFRPAEAFAIDPAPLLALAQIQRENQSPLLASVQDATCEACAAGRRLQAVLSRSGAGPEYPHYPLAQTLECIAQLIRAELGIRIFFAELGGGGIGGFDTHAGQALNHGALLRELAESVAAFVNDLHHDKLLDSVLLMTFSEFGRTLAENGRHGTNHGVAAPVFLVGSRVKGGLVGAHPSLTDLDVDAPKAHTNPRRLYATVLENWLGLESAALLGPGWTPMPGVVGSG
jgi:uncharacterized protein (DUF1501 family)